jgi:hypothetical protein
VVGKNLDLVSWGRAATDNALTEPSLEFQENFLVQIIYSARYVWLFWVERSGFLTQPSPKTPPDSKQADLPLALHDLKSIFQNK